VYAIDVGLVEVISITMTEDVGRKLENLIYLHLRRKYTELYYFDEKGECDFVAMKNGVVKEIIQVCYDLNPDNIKRELNGILQAMKFFNIQNGKIVTFTNTDLIKTDQHEVEIIPAYKYLMDS
jgi:predicted AAA+ superfamily ATPase